jgi:alpha-L-fucosidase 2
VITRIALNYGVGMALVSAAAGQTSTLDDAPSGPNTHRVMTQRAGGNTTEIRTVKPATRWEDAMPLGNGSLGALVYGNICSETVVVNQETLWADTEEPDVPDLSSALPEIRELLEAERWVDASKVMERKLAETGYTPPRTDPYHPAFNLRIVAQPTALFSDYRRVLDLETGEAKLSWKEDDRSYTRDCFVSRADDLICLRFKCSGPGITCAINLQPSDLIEENAAYQGRQLDSDELPVAYKTDYGESSISILGRYRNGNAPFGGYARIILPGRGTIEPLTSIFSTQHRDSLTSGLKVAGADEVIVIIKVFGPRMAETSLSEIRGQVDAITDDYDALFARHTELHRPALTRLKLDLGSTNADRENEYLLLDGYNGDVPTALVEKMFNFGRYLLYTSSAPGGWPANLQGLWNGDYLPPWQSDYHSDENIQMNYWQALPGNLPQTLDAYFDFFEACIPDCQRNAKMLHNCRGILAPIAQDIKGKANPSTGSLGAWTGGAGWLAQPFFDHWLFTQDDAFLEEHAIPYLEQVALFYEDFLFEKDGQLVFAPSVSPENRPKLADGSQVSFTSINATMDIAIAKEVLTNLCEGCRHLGIKAEEVARWEEMIGKLPAYAINEEGALKEWIHPSLHDHYKHRHFPHLYPLFPGFEITRETHPEIFEACRVAVEKRQQIGQDAQSGWSLAHAANIYARLNDGDKALGCIETLIRSSVGPNLFTYHNDWRNMGLTLFWNFKDRLFQIDANFGLTAAVLEMLIYSNRDIIGVLPALPGKWQKGSVSGILCRGGAEIGLEWDMASSRVNVAMTAKRDKTYVLRFAAPIASIKCHSGHTITDSPLGDHFRCIEMKKGETAELEVVLDVQ